MLIIKTTSITVTERARTKVPKEGPTLLAIRSALWTEAEIEVAKSVQANIKKRGDDKKVCWMPKNKTTNEQRMSKSLNVNNLLIFKIKKPSVLKERLYGLYL